MDHRLTSPPSSLGKSELPGPPSLVLWESLSEHRSAALRLPFRGLILNYIPMLDEDSVLNAQNISGNPVYRKTNTAKSPVYEPGTILAEGDIVIVLQRWWEDPSKVTSNACGRRRFGSCFEMSRLEWSSLRCNLP